MAMPAQRNRRSVPIAFFTYDHGAPDDVETWRPINIDIERRATRTLEFKAIPIGPVIRIAPAIMYDFAIRAAPHCSPPLLEVSPARAQPASSARGARPDRP